jgi:hypothetical protein
MSIDLELALYSRNSRWREEFSSEVEAAQYYGLSDMLTAHHIGAPDDDDDDGDDDYLWCEDNYRELSFND